MLLMIFSSSLNFSISWYKSITRETNVPGRVSLEANSDFRWTFEIRVPLPNLMISSYRVQVTIDCLIFSHFHSTFEDHWVFGNPTKRNPTSRWITTQIWYAKSFLNFDMSPGVHVVVAVASKIWDFRLQQPTPHILLEEFQWQLQLCENKTCSTRNVEWILSLSRWDEIWTDYHP